MFIKLITISSILPVVMSTVHAADIAREVSESGASNDSFLEISFSLSSFKLPLIGLTDQNQRESGERINGIDLGLEGQFEYNNFFVEFFTDSFNDVTFGYSMFVGERYSLDLIANDLFGSVKRHDINGFESIEEREGDLNLGIRGNWFDGDNLLQLELLRDVSGAHNGVNASAQLGRQFQLRNWSLHSLAGVRYFSEKVVDHYFGVSAEESTATLPVHNASHGFFPSVLIGATLPLNEKWLFRASAGYSYLPESVRDSPLSQGNEINFVRFGIHRVLYPW